MADEPSQTIKDFLAKSAPAAEQPSAEVAAFLAAHPPVSATPPPPSRMDTAKDIGRAIPRGLIKGIAEIPMSPATLAGVGEDVANYAFTGADRGIRKGINWLGGNVDVPTDEDYAKRRAAAETPLKKGVDSTVDNIRLTEDALMGTPTTGQGRVTQAIAEAIPAAAGGEASLLRRGQNILAQGVLPAGAQQVAQAAGLPPAAQFVASLLTGGTASMALGPSQAERMVGSAARGASDADMQAAHALIQRAQAQGVRLTPAEALQQVSTGASGMGRMQRLAESMRTDEPTEFERMMASRPDETAQAVRGFTGGLAPDTATPSHQGAQLQEASQGALNRQHAIVNNSAEPYYRGSEASLLSPADHAALQQMPGYAAAAQQVAQNEHLAGYVQGLPTNSVGYANEVMKLLRQQADNSGSAINAERNQQISASQGRTADATRDAAVNADPRFAQALDIVAQGRQRGEGPLLAGPLGTMAGTGNPAAQADALMPKSPLVGAGDESAVAARHVMTQGPEATDALQGVVRQGLESDFNAADAPRDRSMSGARFARTVGGNPERQNAIEAVLGETHGPDRAAAFHDLVEALRATGNRQNVGSRTAFNAEDVNALKGGGIEGAIKALTTPVKTGADMLARARLARSTDTLQELMMPGGLERIGELRADMGRSPGQQNILRAILGAARQ